MTQASYCTPGFFEVNHSRLSPRIYNNDFDVHQTMSDIAERIVADWRFDEKCRKNQEYTQRGKRK